MWRDGGRRVCALRERLPGTHSGAERRKPREPHALNIWEGAFGRREEEAYRSHPGEMLSLFKEHRKAGVMGGSGL